MGRTRSARNTSINKNSGFTLIEIMVSILIFVIGIITILYLFPISLKQVKLSKIKTQGLFLAQGVLEEEISRKEPDFSALEGNLGPDFPDFNYAVNKEFIENSWSIFEINVEITHKFNNHTTPVSKLTVLKSMGGMEAE
ncbi:MAG: prepilin-type N-terminal cleavage/methylation domain-containing protein [Vulcanimicrobiota bacterium]